MNTSIPNINALENKNVRTLPDHINKKYIIEWDDIARTITIGNFMISCYHSEYLKRENFMDAVISKNETSVQWPTIEIEVDDELDLSFLYGDSDLKKKKVVVNHKQQMNKMYCSIIGMSSVKFHRHFVKLMTKKYCVDVIPFLRNKPYNCFNSKTQNQKWWMMANKHYHMCKQLEVDGIVKLAPLCMVLGKTPTELKNELGKGLWKRVANDNPSRIGMYAGKLESYLRYHIYDKDGSSDDLKKQVTRMVNTPTTILKQIQVSTYDTNASDIETIKKHRGMYKNTTDLIRNRVDYERMCRQMGVEPRYAPLKQWKDRHDRMVTIYNNWNRERYAASVSPEPFEYPDHVKAVDGVEFGDYVCYLMKTPQDLVDEGREMMHCVGGYNSVVRSGSSVIVGIRKKDGERVSTVEVSKTRDSIVLPEFSIVKYFVRQNYSKYNQKPTDPVVITFGEKIARAITEGANHVEK